MKKKIFKAKMKANIESQKKLYVFLIGLAILAILFGILFIFLISQENLTQIKEQLTTFFQELAFQNFTSLLGSSIVNNLIYVFGIWILGISIIGLPFVIAIFLFKSFLFGFSLSSIIYTYQWQGILRAIFHLFPHQLLFLVVLLLVTFYSVSFSLKLCGSLFFHKVINFKEVMRKYIQILGISFVSTLFISLYEVYISSYLLNFFN